MSLEQVPIRQEVLSVCKIGLTFVEDGHDINLQLLDMGEYVMNQDCISVTIGSSSAPLARVMDSVLMTMKAGETAYVKIKSGAGGLESQLKFNVFLWSFEHQRRCPLPCAIL